MDSFVVSARKYRPANFHSVVGQESITTTLKNALKNNQLAQAFLFCGPRGVGKTTCARILAKTINCEHITPEFEACNTCTSCTSFQEGRSLNVYELDAASNNSVDDIRSLIDQVYYPPQYGTHKVYIIDEVHMLSTQAFNAFLKTLEEPPKYAIFILATTERHKIIPTILSRCQIFDFKRIQIPDISHHLKYISTQEEIKFSEEALNIIAQKADGALRDALSLFDQLCTFTGNNLSYEAVIENLNILDYEYYFKLCQCFAESNISESLIIFDDILQKGFDAHHFVEGMADHFRNLMLASHPDTLKLLEASDSALKKYHAQQALFPKDILIDSLQVVTQTDLNYKNTKNQRLLVEVMLIQLCKVRENLEKKNDEPFEKIEATSPKKPAPSLAIPSSSEETSEKIKKTEPTLVSSQKDSVSSPVVPSKPTGIKTLSISQLLESTPKTEVVSLDTPSLKRNHAFEISDVLPIWQKFAEKAKSEGKGMLYAMLCNTPTLQDQTLTLPLQNRSLEDEFNAHKSALVNLLRDTLHNDKIQLEYTIQATETKQKLYTAKDKWEHLSQDKKPLQILKDVFQLEVEM